MEHKWRRIVSVISLSVILMAMISSLSISAKPTSNMFVIDKADMLSTKDEEKIENALYQIYKQTGIEYVIYLAPSLDGTTIEQASLDIGRNLGIGDKKEDTGILIYVALEEKEFRMEVGYGLEGVIPDSQANNTLNCMTTYFKDGKYADGILAAITNIVKILNDSGEYSVEQDENYVVENEEESTLLDEILICLYIIFFVVGLIIAIRVAIKNPKATLEHRDNDYNCSNRYRNHNSSASHGSFGGGSFGGGGASGKW